MTSQVRYLRAALMVTLFVAAPITTAAANESGTVEPAETSHPLNWTFRYASSRADYIRKNIRDYSCRLIKRERIDGELQKHHFIQVKVRCEQSRDGEVVRPLAVFMEYLAPSSVKGRQVLYVDGENNGNLLVRKGGHAFKYVKLRIDPNGTAARRESNYAITDFGFDRIIGRLIETVTDDIKNDPTAANTEVSHFRGARVNDRLCTHIRVVHPKPGEGLTFHRASLYIDDELHVPIRLTVHGWPEREGDDPPLIEEYTYVDLQLNVGFSDSEFSDARLNTSPGRNAPAPNSLAR